MSNDDSQSHFNYTTFSKHRKTQKSFIEFSNAEGGDEAGRWRLLRNEESPRPRLGKSQNFPPSILLYISAPFRTRAIGLCLIWPAPKDQTDIFFFFFIHVYLPTGKKCNFLQPPTPPPPPARIFNFESGNCNRYAPRRWYSCKCHRGSLGTFGNSGVANSDVFVYVLYMNDIYIFYQNFFR